MNAPLKWGREPYTGDYHSTDGRFTIARGGAQWVLYDHVRPLDDGCIAHGTLVAAKARAVTRSMQYPRA